MKTLNTKSYRLGYATDGPTAVYRGSSVGSDAESRKSFYIRMAIMVVAACIFVFAASQIGMIFYKYYESDKIYANISGEVLNEDSGHSTTITLTVDGEDSTEGVLTVEAFNYDHEALLARNADAIGYIYMPASNMRLPIVQPSEENSAYYLTHSIDGTSNSSGTIYEMADIKGGISATNVILQGHHMKNDGMFAPLKYYSSGNGESYYHSGNNDVFYIYTGNRIIQYKIFTVHIDEPDSSTYTFNFPNLESLRAYAEEMKSLSMYDTGVDVSNTTQIITLSTCTATGDQRIVVQGTYVGEGVLDSSDQ